MQRKQSVHVQSFEQILTRLRETKRRQARSRGLNSHNLNSHNNDGANRTDMFSALLSKLGDHPLVIFGSLLLCLLFLSIACNHVFGQTDASPSVAESRVQPGSASTDVNTSAQSP